MGTFLDEIVPLACEASRNFKETFKRFQKGAQQPLPATVPFPQMIRKVCGNSWALGPLRGPLCSAPGLSADPRWFLSRGRGGRRQSAGGRCEVQCCVSTWYQRFWFLLGLISLEAGRQGWVGAPVRSFCTSRLTLRVIRPNLSLSAQPEALGYLR